MSGWLVALIAVSSSLAYLIAGYVTGRYVSRWAYDLTDRDRYSINSARTNALIAFYVGLVLWPVVSVVAFFASFDGMVPQIKEEKDVAKRKAAERALAEAQAEVNRLHRELGIAPLTDRDAS